MTPLAADRSFLRLSTARTLVTAFCGELMDIDLTFSGLEALRTRAASISQQINREKTGRKRMLGALPHADDMVDELRRGLDVIVGDFEDRLAKCLSEPQGNSVEILKEGVAIYFMRELIGAKSLTLVTRLYVPKRVRDGNRITRVIGREAAEALCAHYSPDWIRVPLMRELRVKHHRANGLSNARIAVRLGMAETGVAKLAKRLKLAPRPRGGLSVT